MHRRSTVLSRLRVAPSTLTQEQIDRALDQGVLREYSPNERRSLFRLFRAFSGYQGEQKEGLTQEEVDELALPQ